MIGTLLAHRNRHRHLRHDGGTTPTNQAAIDQIDAGTSLGRRQCGKHAGAASADDEHITFEFDHVQFQSLRDGIGKGSTSMPSSRRSSASCGVVTPRMARAGASS